jgi:RHS repeat-associated protein
MPKLTALPPSCTTPTKSVSSKPTAQSISYDPFSKRTVTAGTNADLKAWTARGFTGHEHLDNLGLIHMNTRLYDPEIGQFISVPIHQIKLKYL